MRPRLCGNRIAAVIAKSACLSCIHLNKKKIASQPFRRCLSASEACDAYCVKQSLFHWNLSLQSYKFCSALQ